MDRSTARTLKSKNAGFKLDLTGERQTWNRRGLNVGSVDSKNAKETRTLEFNLIGLAKGKQERLGTSVDVKT